jgi:AraC family transcriptional regulator
MVMLQNKAQFRSYEARLARVTAYIYDHLDDNLDLNVLADIACLSTYHWHRVYSAIYGETIIDTVRRLRLQRAAGCLAQTDTPISTIAKAAGYASVPPFTRAFRAAYGQPPGAFREAGNTELPRSIINRRETMPEVRFEAVPARRLATIPHEGSYLQIGRAFDTLFGTLAARGLIAKEMRSIAIFYDDPGSVAEAALRSCAAATVTADFPMTAPFIEAQMPALRAAVLRHQGPYSGLRASYDWFYGQWLPSSGEEPADLPPFEDYLNTPRDTAPPDLLTEIYMPLKAR